MMSLNSLSAKSEPTYYTPDRVARGRANLAAGHNYHNCISINCRDAYGLSLQRDDRGDYHDVQRKRTMKIATIAPLSYTPGKLRYYQFIRGGVGADYHQEPKFYQYPDVAIFDEVWLAGP